MKTDSVSEREGQASMRLAEAVEAQLWNKEFAALLPAACEIPFRRQSKASGVLELEKCSLQHMARLERGKRDPDGQRAVVLIARESNSIPLAGRSIANMSAIGALMSSLDEDLRFRSTTVKLFPWTNSPMGRDVLAT